MKNMLWVLIRIASARRFHSNEYPQRMSGDSNEYPQHMFFMEKYRKLSFNYHLILSLSVPLVSRFTIVPLAAGRGLRSLNVELPECHFFVFLPWGENLIILVIYFTYPVNPFIARSGISQLREFP